MKPNKRVENSYVHRKFSSTWEIPLLYEPPLELDCVLCGQKQNKLIARPLLLLPLPPASKIGSGISKLSNTYVSTSN